MTTIDRHTIGLEVDGERLIHAVDATGVYATLCGLDGEEHQTFKAPLVRQRIDCPQCFLVWNQSRKYRADDFTDKVRRLK